MSLNVGDWILIPDSYAWAYSISNGPFQVCGFLEKLRDDGTSAIWVDIGGGRDWAIPEDECRPTRTPGPPTLAEKEAKRMASEGWRHRRDQNLKDALVEAPRPPRPRTYRLPDPVPLPQLDWEGPTE